MYCCGSPSNFVELLPFPKSQLEVVLPEVVDVFLNDISRGTVHELADGGVVAKDGNILDVRTIFSNKGELPQEGIGLLLYKKPTLVPMSNCPEVLYA